MRTNRQFDRQFNRQFNKKLTSEKWYFELNNKWNKLIKGFPGLLHTLGTLLDRSQTIKQIFKKCQKLKGPMGPRGLGPKTRKLSKSLKTMKISVFFQRGSDAHRDFEKGALNDSSRSLIWSFLEQIVFLRIAEKCQVLHLDQFWVHPRWS